jgi:hypothetical protein
VLPGTVQSPGRVRGKGSLAAGGRDSGGQRVGSGGRREGHQIPQRGVLRGFAGSWLTSGGVYEREAFRQSAKLKYALDRWGAGDDHEVDFQACGPVGEFEDALNAG